MIRPGLERLRDQAAAGAIDRLYVLDPDRFSRKYAYQVLILEELTRCGVEVVFLQPPPPAAAPEENLLLQVQGMIAEYERAKILERSRRGKQHAARRGSVNVLSGAPYGYRYISKHDGRRRGALPGPGRGGSCRPEDLRVGRSGTLFDRRGVPPVEQEGIPTRTGKPAWDRATIWRILKNPAYKGTAAFGKTRVGALKPQRLRPLARPPRAPQAPDVPGRHIARRIKSSSMSPRW